MSQDFLNDIDLVTSGDIDAVMDSPTKPTTGRRHRGGFAEQSLEKPQTSITNLTNSIQNLFTAKPTPTGGWNVAPEGRRSTISDIGDGAEKYHSFYLGKLLLMMKMMGSQLFQISKTSMMNRQRLP